MVDFERIIDRRGTSSLKWERYRDRDILPMWVADMDFAAPEVVLQALRQRLAHGILGYTVAPRSLLEAIVERMEQRYGWQVQPHWIVWLPGLVVGLNVACRAVGEPGDEVVTFTPIYPPFLSAPEYSDRVLVPVPLARRDDRSVIDLDGLRRALTPRTKLLLLCHPHNPVGRAWRPEELRPLAELCVERGITICSDEVHCDLILDDVPHVPTATLGPEIEARTITLLSPSKTFNLPGLDCAYAIVPDDTLRRRIARVRRGIVPYVNLFGYHAAEAAYRRAEPWRRALLEVLRENRARVEQAVAALPGLRMDHVEATYLAWIDARDLGVETPHRFFELAGVGLSDGRDFGAPGFVRLNFGCPPKLLEQGLQRIARAVGQVAVDR